MQYQDKDTSEGKRTESCGPCFHNLYRVCCVCTKSKAGEYSLENLIFTYHLVSAHASSQELGNA